ncbi:CWC16 protein [Colletotrichum godetiae]|uniref:CWC16 protein n=1 Tax=Colletotrichum godetiae TaxID=1209918 RepID=A0AAJ0AFI9_9PEZI|nr:CWC16 protein [Colletotrichum godetiae]KAK1672964.1 CWC16 protein [Colletotrichum godetiae]
MQGFNMGRYVPPDQEGTTTGNKLNRKHPLGARAAKPGILVVRFEMPFAIWCATCPKPTIIGQGVRFNAEKKRVGSYFTSAIWQFRMKHADCGGWIEIHTDPKNTAYVVVSGAKKRDTGEEGRTPQEGEMPAILTEEEREKLRSNAFASLEKTIEDRQQLAQATERIDELQDAASRAWDDPYTRNKALRATFREGRHQREKDAAVGEALKEKMSLGIELVPETEEDVRRARLVDFGGVGEGVDEAGVKAFKKPLFVSSSSSLSAPSASVKDGKAKKSTRTTTGKAVLLPKGTPKAEVLASKRRDTIVSEIVGNTRMARDPFLVESKAERSSALRIPGLKRRRDEDGVQKQELLKATEPGQSTPSSKSLVAYDSDSD